MRCERVLSACSFVRLITHHRRPVTPEPPSSPPLQTQMAKGFGRVEGSLEDLALDAPTARDTFPALRQRAIDAGWLKPGSD